MTAVKPRKKWSIHYTTADVGLRDAWLELEQEHGSWDCIPGECQDLLETIPGAFRKVALRALRDRFPMAGIRVSIPEDGLAEESPVDFVHLRKTGRRGEELSWGDDEGDDGLEDSVREVRRFIDANKDDWVSSAIPLFPDPDAGPPAPPALPPRLRPDDVEVAEGLVPHELRARLEALLAQRDGLPVLDYERHPRVAAFTAVFESGQWNLGQNAFWKFEGIGLPRRFLDAQTGESLGEIQFVEGSYPGVNDRGIRVSSTMALSLLQLALNELEPGVRVKVDE